MNFTILLWLLVWAGIYTGLYSLRSPQLLADPFAFFQGARALLPVLAVYLCLAVLFMSRSRLIPSFKTPLGCLFGYCLVGIISSFFSPNTLKAVYWGTLYLSPLLVVWISSRQKNATDNFRTIIHINYLLAIIMVTALVPEALRIGLIRMEIYMLPFNLGQIRANGVGRFALVVIIISFVRLITQRKRQRFLWLIPLIPSLYLLLQSQSRSSLLGFAIAGILIVYLKGMDWRFVFVGPIAAYIVWFSGLQLRAQGQIGNLFDLRGREYTWQMGIDLFEESPFFGWGFHADRIMLKFQHMHNSYFHALVQSGVVGTLFFIGAIIGIWILIFRNNIPERIRNVHGVDQALLIESILFLAFLTVRSFFESTGAFYGVDLLVLVPIIGYIQLWSQKNPLNGVSE